MEMLHEKNTTVVQSGIQGGGGAVAVHGQTPTRVALKKWCLKEVMPQTEHVVAIAPNALARKFAVTTILRLNQV
jgi:hypothetical protein